MTNLFLLYRPKGWSYFALKRYFVSDMRGIHRFSKEITLTVKNTRVKILTNQRTNPRPGCSGSGRGKEIRMNTSKVRSGLMGAAALYLLYLAYQMIQGLKDPENTMPPWLLILFAVFFAGVSVFFLIVTWRRLKQPPEEEKEEDENNLK